MNTTAVDLRTDAVAEARRLTAARELGDGRALFEASGALISRARNARTRAALAGRTLFVWRVACADECGRTSPAAIVALLLRLDACPRGRVRRPSIRNLIDAIDARAPDTVAAELRVRQRAIVEIAVAHADARLARERAIAADVSRSMAGAKAYQAGLFDRRSERTHRLRATEAQDVEQLIRTRIAAAASAAAISPSRPTLLLVLTP
jgi:hypothetical protein